MPRARVVVLARRPLERAKRYLTPIPPGVSVTFLPSDTPLEQVIEACREADAIIPAFAPLPLEVLRRCPGVKLVQLTSAGYDIYDLKAIDQLGVPLANNGGANASSVAEHTIGLMLMVYRRLHLLWDNARQGRWNYGYTTTPFREIRGKTVGIIGLGRIGRQVARRLLGFETRTLYHDIAEIPPEVERELRVERAPLEELLARSDIVTLHVPLTPSTRGLIGHRQLALMKREAVLINTSRGAVVDEEALLSALREGRLAGAGLDVLAQEPPPPDHPLLHMENAVVTPHLAGTSVETWERTARFVYGNILRVVEGRPPESLAVPYD